MSKHLCIYIYVLGKIYNLVREFGEKERFIDTVKQINNSTINNCK